MSDATQRVMLDLETLGLEPGATILSLGAVAFDLDGPNDWMHRSISIKSCEAAGLSIDADTLEWWLDQDADAQDVLTGGDELADVLHEFGAFYGDADELWANSPRFDCAILGAAYDAVEIAQPWGYWEERCFRTLKKLPTVEDVERQGVEHDALDDAMHQARVAAATLEGLQ